MGDIIEFLMTILVYVFFFLAEYLSFFLLIGVISSLYII